MRGRRLFLFTVGACAAATVVAVACGTETVYVTAPNDGGTDGTTGRDAKKPSTTPSDDDDVAPSDDDDDVVAPPKDAGKDAAPKDAGSDARLAKDANGPGAVGEDCSFNHDCQLALRCECDGLCGCKAGTRGTNKLGTSCDGGSQCEGALCVEGANNVDFFCSDECAGPADCPATLPRCISIASIGKFCARQP